MEKSRTGQLNVIELVQGGAGGVARKCSAENSYIGRVIGGATTGDVAVGTVGFLAGGPLAAPVGGALVGYGSSGAPFTPDDSSGHRQ